MAEEHRAQAPAAATGAVEFVRLEDVSTDEAFRLRPPGDVEELATSIGRLGQLEPVEVRARPGGSAGEPPWQVVAGFRRVEALRLLQRDRVLARIHDALSDDDAWALALSHALLHEPLTAIELEELRERLRVEAAAPWAEELVDAAQARAPVPPDLRERFHAFLRQRTPRGEAETVELSPEELVDELLRKLYEINVDVAAAWEAWSDLPPEGRRQIVEQARYLHELFPFMAGDAE